MKNQFTPPSAFELYALEQQRKKKARKIIIIVVAIIVGIWTIGIMALVSFTYNDNLNQSTIMNTNNKTEVMDSTLSRQTQTQNESVELDPDEQEIRARHGLVSLEIYVKDNMDDSNSFEEISYDYSYHKDYFIIVLKFRGKNAFGGKVINYIKAKTDLDGNILKILDNY